MKTLRRYLAWRRIPWDRCMVGGHKMWTKDGYRLCKLHAECDL